MAHVMGQGLARAVFPYKLGFFVRVSRIVLTLPEGDEYDDEQVECFPTTWRLIRSHQSRAVLSTSRAGSVTRALFQKVLCIYPL